MNDREKTKEQPGEELAQLRGQVADLEAHLARAQQAVADQRRINDCLPVLVATAGLDGYYKQVNAAFERILGWSEQELLSRPFLEFIHPEDRARALRTFAGLESGVPAIDFLDRNVCKDGSCRWINWTMIPVPDRDIVYGIGQDVTGKMLAEDERKRAEEAVRQSEQRMRLHVQQTPLAVIEWDVNARVSKWNPGAERTFGHSVQEALGQHFSFLVPATHHDRVGHVFNALLVKKGGERSTNENVTKDGRVILCEWYNTPLVNAEGQVIGVASLAEDITERKRAEAALQESERRLATLISNLPGAVYRCKADSDWTIEFLSDGYLQLTGHDPSEAIGQPGTLHSERIHPEDRQREFDEVQRAVAEKRAFHVEYRLRMATGEEKWVWEQGRGVFSDSGELVAIEGFTTDITDHKRIKQELQDANERLEQRVAERTAELTTANELLRAEVQQRRQAEEKTALFRRFVEAATQGFGMADADGQIIYVNPFLARLFGAQRPEDVIGTHVSSYYPPSYLRRRETEIIPALRRGESWRGEQNMAYPDGQMHTTIHTVFPVVDDNGRLLYIAAVISDITELKRVEESLRKNEAKYRALIESCPDPVVVIDLQGRIVFASQQASEQHGILDPGEFLGGQVTDHVLESERERFRASASRLTEDGVHRNIEYTLLRKDGTTFQVELSSAVIRDAHGNPEAFMAVYRDISERKQAEEKLAIFGRFVEAASQGFGMSDLEGRITYVNPMMVRLLREKRAEDVLGKNISTYHTSDYFRFRDEVIRPVLRRGGHWQGELPLLQSDGTILPTLRSIFPVRDTNGDVHHFAVVITDITEIKQAQQALQQTCEELRASEERFQLVVQGAGVGIWDWDIRTGRVYYSPRWKALFGYDENEIGEGFEDWARLLHPDEREGIIKSQEDVLAATSSTITAEYRLRHKDGSYRWIEGHGVVVRDEQGRACRLVGSHGDITDRKQAEEKLRREQRALRRMVLASDHERRLITYELHDGVAQQLLGAMLLFESQERVRGRKSKGTSGAYRDGLDALRHAASELRRVMNWLKTPVLEKFGVAEAIEDVAAQLRLAPGAPDIEYSHAVKFQRLEPTLENTLFRIAQEAMTNACRHSKSEKVRVKLTQKGDGVTLEVRDWGIGFAPDAVAENRFGLEGIRERSRILGGKLTIKSEPGRGTVIRVTFPVMEPAPSQPPGKDAVHA